MFGFVVVVVVVEKEGNGFNQNVHHDMMGKRMARVLAKFFATVREATGVRSAEVEANSIRELLEILSNTYPKFSGAVLKEGTVELKQFYSCMVNGRRIELLDSYDTLLEDDDAVALFPPIGGG